MPTRDNLHEAFEAWHRAVDEHIQMMRDVSNGDPLDAQAMTRAIGEIETLHGTWMDIVSRRDDAARAQK